MSNESGTCRTEAEFLPLALFLKNTLRLLIYCAGQERGRPLIVCGAPIGLRLDRAKIVYGALGLRLDGATMYIPTFTPSRTQWKLSIRERTPSLPPKSPIPLKKTISTSKYQTRVYYTHQQALKHMHMQLPFWCLQSQSPNTPVAVKLLKDEEKDTSQARCNLLLEAAVLQQFSHPNVLKLLGIVRDPVNQSVSIPHSFFFPFLFSFQLSSEFGQFTGVLLK